MAKATWCTVDPATGSGNGSVNVSVPAHTGRNQRTTTPTWEAAGVADKVVNCTQHGKPEFVILNDMTVPKGGGTVTVTGVTNSSKLTFTLGAGSLTVTLPTSYVAGGATIANGSPISGDPGATEQFDFSIQFTVDTNPTITERKKEVIVTADGGQTASADITQAAGDPTLSVTPTTLTFENTGGSKTVSVSSNTSWKVS